MICILALQDGKKLRAAGDFLHTPLAPLRYPAEPVTAGTLPHFHVALASFPALSKSLPVPLLLRKKVDTSAQQRQRDAQEKADQHEIQEVHPVPLNVNLRPSTYKTPIQAGMFLRKN